MLLSCIAGSSSQMQKNFVNIEKKNWTEGLPVMKIKVLPSFFIGFLEFSNDSAIF